MPEYKVYEYVSSKDISDMCSECGFTFLPKAMEINKEVVLGMDDEATKFLLSNFYANKQWVDQVYNKKGWAKAIRKSIGLSYNKDGSIRKSKKFQDVLLKWTLSFSLEPSGAVLFAVPSDPNNNYVFCSSELLDKWFKPEIDKLLVRGYIKECEKTF